MTFLHTAEDMDWLFDVHCPDYRGKAASAILTGNEDAPYRITLFASASPTIHDTPVADIIREENWHSGCGPRRPQTWLISDYDDPDGSQRRHNRPV